MPKILYRRLVPRSLKKVRALKGAVLHETNVRPTRGRLYMRLVYCRDAKAMRKVARFLERPVCRRTSAATMSMMTGYFRRHKRTNTIASAHYVVDRECFAVMLLCGPVKPSVEIVAHECGHAALFYAQRNRRHAWGGRVRQRGGPRFDIPLGFDHTTVHTDTAGERICYPLGVIMRDAVRALYRWGVWP